MTLWFRLAAAPSARAPLRAVERASACRPDPGHSWPRPTRARKYLGRRTKKVTANREVAVFSTIFNRGREWGYTSAANPCQGVHRNRELGRDKYVTDAEYRALYEKADPVLRDAMDLAYYTGQRVADVLKMKRADIHEGALWVRQAKTKAKLRIAIEGELAAVIERIRARAVVGVEDCRRLPNSWAIDGSGLSTCFWRRGRDSNPRYGKPYNRFRVSASIRDGSAPCAA